MRRSIRSNVSVISTVVMTAFVVFSFIIAFFCLKRMNAKHQEQIAYASMEFATLTINADNARECLSTRKTDAQFLDIQEKLKQYCNNNRWTKRISLINFTSSNGNYIYDTEGSRLGQKLDFNRYHESVKAELINGRKSWNTERGGKYYSYAPLRTVDDVLAGYVIIELDTSYSNRYFAMIAAVYAVVMLGGFAFSRFLLHYMDRILFRPIRHITEMAENFSSSSENEASDDNKTYFIDAERDDEISDLSRAVQKMFMDINSGAESLSKAIYDANHDGMTQVFNKRCYKSMEEVFRKQSSICVVYFDVNNLKLMNDTLGHECGDIVIKNAADYIKKLMGDTDYCFRMGGDEFVLIMTECTYRDIEKLIDHVEADSPYLLNRSSDSIKCALSYGYAYAKAPYDYDAIMTEAEENMYVKKAELKELLNMPDR